MTPDQKETLLKSIQANHKPFESLTIKEIDKCLFKRPGRYNRLSFQGYVVMKKLYDCWEFNIDREGTFNTRSLIALARVVTFPYYIGKERVVLYSSEDAFVVKLHGNDLSHWLDTEFSLRKKDLT